MSGNNKKVANRNSREYFAVFSEDLREKLNEQCFKVKRTVWCTGINSNDQREKKPQFWPMVYSQNMFAGRISNLEKNFQTKNGIADHPEPIVCGYMWQVCWCYDQ